MQLFYMLFKSVIIVIIVMLCVVGCQEEYDETYSFGEDELITGTDSIVTYILNMTNKDGSFDDLIDECSEICIVFPYSIQIRNEKFDISSMEELDEIINNYTEYENNIVIDYPVTIMYSDYTEESIPNRGELNKIQHMYSSETGNKYRVSIDFVYPVNLSLYNSLYQTFDSVTTAEDKEMYKVFNSIGDMIIAINYPVKVKNAENDSVVISNNKELQNVIEYSIE